MSGLPAPAEEDRSECWIGQVRRMRYLHGREQHKAAGAVRDFARCPASLNS
jgi:hypothetical protein